MLNQKRILISGGAGSFEQKFIRRIHNEFDPAKIVIYSRDEYKYYVMRAAFENEFGKAVVKE
jgi:UDP-N-acetylglucosamine 4,6-dehydratase/5-epimerase